MPLNNGVPEQTGLLLSTFKSETVFQLSSHGVSGTSQFLWLIEQLDNYQVIACIYCFTKQ